MPIKISQLPEALSLRANNANNLLVIVDSEEQFDYLKTKKISVENFLKSAIEYGNTPNVYYVSPGGNDGFDGKSWDQAFKSIERSLEIAEERDGQITLIELGPGIYETEGHLDMPDNTIIRAAHRSVVITPKSGFEERNVFRMGSGCFIEGPLFEDWRLDDMDNPTEGFAVSFRPGAVIRRTPYAHKIAVRTTPYWGVVSPPLDRNNGNPLIGRGMGVALADGNVCSPYSVFPNIMTWGATPVSHNGIGYCAKNGGLINAVNAVSIWQHKHFYAIDGGQIILSSCSTQFGDYTMVANGTRSIVVPNKIEIEITPQPSANTIINNDSELIINDMWNSLVANGYTVDWDDEDEIFTRRDAKTFIQSVIWTIETGNETPMLDFAKGLFNVDATPVFTPDKLDAFVYSFNYMKNRINLLPGITEESQTIISALIDALNNTVTNPPVRQEPSTITAIGHTWTGIFAGVALTKIPPAKNVAKIQDSILELNQGLVIASGQDEQGSALFVGGMEIDSDTGELSGPPFQSAVNRIATKAVISRSF
jgi:hypothetical protein